ncbi:MAG: IS66 family insertion sequence element accessory protein TnpB [Candidatus Cloacimonetes bacterium]|nr:IS66 family insertion sequence element accessory protein TnpB [Candidatus Cloacimonadota bacterium]
MFVFINRSHNSIRILFYDSQGFWLCQKRLSSGRFRNWPRGGKTDASIVSLVEAELSVLLRGGRINNLYLKPAFRQIREVIE